MYEYCYQQYKIKSNRIKGVEVFKHPIFSRVQKKVWSISPSDPLCFARLHPFTSKMSLQSTTLFIPPPEHLLKNIIRFFFPLDKFLLPFLLFSFIFILNFPENSSNVSISVFIFSTYVSDDSRKIVWIIEML